MKVIDIKKARQEKVTTKRLTVLSYGASRAGKTRFAGSFPRPIFLSEATESGWTTLTTMEDDVLYEPGVYPEVWAIEQPADMMQSLVKLEEITKREPQRFQTVVIDSLTFYAEAFLNMLEGQAASNPKEQGLRVFMKYLQHIRHLMGKMHQLPLNVVWLCLSKDPGEGENQGGIMLTGQSSKIAPARCDYWFYQRAFRRVPDAPIEYALHTRGYGQWPAGGRDGGQLPDVITDVTYRGLMAALQGKPQAATVQAPSPNGQQQQQQQPQA